MRPRSSTCLRGSMLAMTSCLVATVGAFSTTGGLCSTGLLRAPAERLRMSTPHDSCQPLPLARREALMKAVRAAEGALGVGVLLSMPARASADGRSFEEFKADKDARQREPGEIKEGETRFTFAEKQPLGIDLTEVRISRENGGNRVAIKGIRPDGQAADMQDLVPGMILEVVQGTPVSGMTPEATIKLVVAEKKKRDAEGKNLSLVFGRGTVLQRYEIREQREKEVAKLRKDIAAATAAAAK